MCLLNVNGLLYTILHTDLYQHNQKVLKVNKYSNQWGDFPPVILIKHASSSLCSLILKMYLLDDKQL